MPLAGRGGVNNVNNTLKVEQVLNGVSTPAPMGLGMEMRTRAGLYPEILKSARSIYNQTDNITTTERSFGMPDNSSQDIYTRLTGTTGSGLQISSSSLADNGTSATGALTIYIEGLYISGNDWIERSTYSTPTTLNGRTAVQIGSDVDWYRINKIWVLTTGSGNKNAGDLYISPLGQSLSLGVPTGNILQAMIAGYGNSTGGFFSVASNQRFEYCKGNFWMDPTKAIRIHETFFQDFGGSANTADMSEYEVGLYPSETVSFDYTAAAPYTEKTDISLTIRTTNGTADAAVLYVEYLLSNATKVNN